MYQVFVIAAILVGSAYGISVPFTQSYPTTSDTGLKYESVHINPCTALPCKFAHGTSMETDMEFKAQADYDLTDAYNVGFVKLGGKQVEMAREFCDLLSIISGDKDGNPCTVNAGGQYKIQCFSPVYSVFPDGEYNMEGEVIVGDKIIADYKVTFDVVN